ncbi:MAG: orotidine-5'-phosphate decarboxylase [bacterium]|nr:orotidine-5'-phosphate decarboxylase [bacterium]
MSLPDPRNPRDAADRLICALDVPSLDEAKALLDALAGRVRWFKVGMELFTSAGPLAVAEILARGAGVFLDLKFHDIPTTVERAVAAAGELGVSLLTVHASGGPAMLEACARGRDRCAAPPVILAVTVLTSVDQTTLSATGIERPMEAQVLAGARLAQEARIDGIVASPREVASLRRELGDGLLIVTPGVRLDEGGHDDHARAETPRKAIAAGSDMLVVGRPIRDAKDREKSIRAFLDSIDAGLRDRERPPA